MKLETSSLQQNIAI